MAGFKLLDQAIVTFNKNVTNFPIGAVCPRDFKPVDEKVADTRECLKHLNGRLLSYKAEEDAQATANIHVAENLEETHDKLEEATLDALLMEKIVNLCLHSHALETEFSVNGDNSIMLRTIQSYMQKLFALNDSMTKLETPMGKLYEKQLDLKIECQKSLFAHQKFMVEQKCIQNAKLQEMNPEIALTKGKMYNTLRKINVMKRLITNFIAASGHLLVEQPMLAEMLEKHWELISVETILKMFPNVSEES